MDPLYLPNPRSRYSVSTYCSMMLYNVAHIINYFK